MDDNVDGNEETANIVHDLEADNALDSDEVLRRFRKILSTTFETLEIPAIGGMRSNLMQNCIEPVRTTIATMPLIPGPASSMDAIYTSLITANKISMWACGDTGKTIVCLDLDLYAKVYMLVNCCDELRGKFVLRLGELHIVFALIRAIGTYIESSGIDDAWKKSGLFGDNTVKQILGCTKMKRAVQAHECTLVVFYIFFIRDLLLSMSENVLNRVEDLKSLISELRSSDIHTIQNAFKTLSEWLSESTFKEKFEDFKRKLVQNAESHFILNYIEMVSVLLKFIHASRSRDWIMHLSSVKDMIPFITAMDRIKYRRLLPVYLADMKKLKDTDPVIWNYFEEGNFSVQNTDILGSALGIDHAGEQENKKLKIQGGLIGITRQQISRDRYFLIAHIVSEIDKEMREMSGCARKERSQHHDLTPSVKHRQAIWITNLHETLSSVNFVMLSEADTRLYNILSERVFPSSINEQVLNVKAIGDEMYTDFVTKRLLPSSEMSIWAPVKKANLQTFKKSIKPQAVILDGNSYELETHCDFFAKCAVLSQNQEIDMERIIGYFELSTAPPSFFDIGGNPNDGGQNKSELVHSICKTVPEAWNDPIPEVDIVVFDAMSELNRLKKTGDIKKFKYIADTFICIIERKVLSASTVIVSFDTYQDISLKERTRERRKNNAIAIEYEAADCTDISDVKMEDILSHWKTKRELTKFLAERTVQHLRKRLITFVVAGNGVTVTNETISYNNHEESDTLMRYCLTLVNTKEQLILVRSNDTDVFTIMIGLHHRLDCKTLYIEWTSDKWINATEIWRMKGDARSQALISMHIFSGCDTVEKFSSKAKVTWVNCFEKCSDDTVEAFKQLHIDVNETVVNTLEKFVCKAYTSMSSKIEKLSADI